VCRPESWISRQLDGEPIEILESTLKRRPSEIRRVGRWLRDRGVDVIHTHMSSAHLFGVILKFTAGMKCVATAHNRKFQPHWLFNDRVIAVSDATAEYHRRVNWVSPRRMTTVRNFIDLEKYRGLKTGTRERIRSEFGFEDQHLVVGTVGEVIERKGVRYLVSALPQVLSACPDARVLVVGSLGPPNAYARHTRDVLARELGVADKIVWTDHRSDVPDLLSAMDVFAQPSLEEQLPLSIIEAMAAGLPTVATRAGGTPEVVVDDVTGYLVDPEDVDALAEAIGRFTVDARLRATMGQAGREYAYKCFSPETQVPRIEDVLDQAVSGRVTLSLPVQESRGGFEAA
jgi:glycosyltransferase involved in cell wall biosynthesis